MLSRRSLESDVQAIGKEFVFVGSEIARSKVVSDVITGLVFEKEKIAKT